MPERIHKIKVEYILELTAEQKKRCLKFANVLGFNHDQAKPQIVLKRLFKDMGESAILKALEFEDYNVKND